MAGTPPLTLITAPYIPNPDLVHCYLLETGRDSTLVKKFVKLGKNENRDLTKNPNPLGEVPCLILRDGTALSESTTICKYLDEVHGASSLIGLTAYDRAMTDMWIRRIEAKVEVPIGEAFRSGPMLKFFESRRPGWIQPEIVSPARKQGQAGLRWLEGVLSSGGGRPFLCGERLSLADLRFFFNVGFYLKSDPDQSLPDDCTHVAAYMARIAARPSVKSLARPPKKATKSRL